ncbi:LCP family protein [Cohnella nanjingensis]|uniref:LCP family protein n=1 Tax=Cohnella nanjingensis TaxID=1387779 RepID=A0A7X0VIL3_9BACL|nr:LCP family protein [Cohnella nanjingensis]MBB6675340.1 LCP family protein [Cohnella nanjingensis]
MTPLKNKKWLRKTLIRASITLGALILAVGGYAGYLYYKADDAIGKMSSHEPAATATPTAPAATNEGGAEPVKQDEYRPHTFLLAGIDHRVGSGGSLNTDVLMLGSINPGTHSASLVSLPRDLQLKPKTLSAHKANYYYAYFYNKDKETALTETKAFYSELFDFPIDYMVLINFDGLRKLVDAVGGLDIDVDMDMRYKDSADGTDINLKKGLQHLDGKKVLDFVRYRKSNEGTQQSSDIARNTRQQQVIKELTDQLATFQGMTQWGKVLDLLGDNVKTDIPESEMRQWIYGFNKVKPNTIDMIPLESRWESPYIYVKEDDLKQALASLRTEVGLTHTGNLKLADVVGVDPSPDPDKSN